MALVPYGRKEREEEEPETKDIFLAYLEVETNVDRSENGACVVAGRRQ